MAGITEIEWIGPSPQNSDQYDSELREIEEFRRYYLDRSTNKKHEILRHPIDSAKGKWHRNGRTRITLMRGGSEYRFTVTNPEKLFERLCNIYGFDDEEEQKGKKGKHWATPRKQHP